MKKVLLSILSSACILGASSQAFSAYIYVKHVNEGPYRLTSNNNHYWCKGGNCFVADNLAPYETMAFSNVFYQTNNDYFALRYTMSSAHTPHSLCGIFVSAYKYKWEDGYKLEHYAINTGGDCVVGYTSLYPEFGAFNYEIHQR